VKVSAKAEYACVALVELASHHGDGQPVQIKTIAKAHGLSARFLVQILLQMKGAGLVASSRGAAGGYQLARQPETISLAEIINAIDRAPPRPAALNAMQSTSVVRSLREVWREISKEEQRILAKTSLADLVHRTKASDSLAYEI
jgi:Rrf2 family protein